jgi:hypothetical protein
MKTLLREPSADLLQTTRGGMGLTLDLECSSASPVRSQTSRNLSLYTARASDRSIKRSIKNFHDRKASFEWRFAPMPRRKNYEFKASKPPLNFFASGKVAIRARYPRSPQITGRKECPTPSLKEIASRRKINLKGK